jgi:hypothetical protein
VNPYWRRVWRELLFAFFVLTPSCEQVEKYFGLLGVVAYLALGGAVLHEVLGHLGRLRSRLTERHALGIAVCTLVLVTVAFLVVYPRVNSARPGEGSDLDDEIDLAAGLIVHGDDPYRARTYLGNPIDLLPGELLLGLPFVVVLGRSAYQNLFWLAVLFGVAWSRLRDARDALLLWWLLQAASPVVLQQVMTGGDHVSNAVHVMTGTLLVARAKPSGALGWPVLGGVGLLGLGLSSRANFSLLLPLVVGLLVRRAGWRRALGLTALVVGVAVAVTVPFYLRDPAGFVWLGQLATVTRFDGAAGLGGASLMLVVAGGVALLAATRVDAGNVDSFLRRAAIVQAVPVWWLVVLNSLHAGRPVLLYTGYGTFYLCFGALALWPVLRHPDPGTTADRGT